MDSDRVAKAWSGSTSRTVEALATSLALASVVVPRHAVAGEVVDPWSARGYETNPYPSLFWTAMQLIPSPTMGFGNDGARFGLRWQVTPVSYSRGLNDRVRPWRFLVVEPHARHGGSIELYGSPEVYFGDPIRWTVRPGVRATFPVLDRGEYLSVSIGSSYQRFGDAEAVALEGGAYILFGILGLQVSTTPAPDQPLSTFVSARLKYF